MPGQCSPYEDRGPLIAAWTAYYVRKGCTSTKAKAVAWRRVQRKSTWPPEGEPGA